MVDAASVGGHSVEACEGKRPIGASRHLPSSGSRIELDLRKATVLHSAQPRASTYALKLF